MIRKSKRKGLIGLLGVGIVGGILASGCDTTSEAAFGSVVYGNLARTELNPRKAQGYGVISELYRTQYEREAAKEVAREGASKVEVNVQYPEQRREVVREPVREQPRVQEREQIAKFFACNYWKDFNNDGSGSLDEFVGIKTKFRKNERIELASYIVGFNNLKGKTLKIEIWDPIGEKVYSVEQEILDDNLATRTGDDGSLMNWLLNKGGIGSYKSVWYVNDKLVGSCDFEISE